MVSFLLVVESSNDRLLMKNNQFLLPENTSGVDPNLDSLVDDGSQIHTVGNHVEKNAVQYDQERSHRSFTSSNSATKDQKLPLRLNVDDQKTENIKANGVFNLLPKGRVTPSGPSPIVNSMLTEHEFYTSKDCPGVGHTQMIRPKSQIIRAHVLKSDHSQGDHHVVQRKTSKKRKLGSIPSPGGGNI